MNINKIKTKTLLTLHFTNILDCIINYNNAKNDTMKNFIKSTTLAIIMMVSISSCKKDDSTSPNSSSSISTTMQSGKWRITFYEDSGNNETNHFTGYSFQFNSNGTIVATNSGNSTNGTWSNGNDDSQTKLLLNFTSTPFDELSDDWHVIQQNSSIIKLEDVSGGGSGTDYLTFEKI